MAEEQTAIEFLYRQLVDGVPGAPRWEGVRYNRETGDVVVDTSKGSFSIPGSLARLDPSEFTYVLGGEIDKLIAGAV
jgi:hypothetical protein